MGEYPKLRNVEAIPTEVNGSRVLCLRDPANYAESVLFIPLPALEIIRYFDGRHSILDIQAAYVRRHGELLFREKVEELVATLDQHYFLEGERFERYRREVEARFQQAGTRTAFSAGRSYPPEPSALQEMLDKILAHPQGPDPRVTKGTLRALIAPHIDFLRGAVGYAWAYRSLPEATDARLFIILGTAHAGTARPFAPCLKDFATPLGTVSTDRDFIAALAERCPEVMAVDDFAHRGEHSIEFQVVFLQHLLGAKRPIRIVPILCALPYEWLLAGKVPSEDPKVRTFLQTLRELIVSQQEPVCLIAGADLAHMGPRFGDPEPVSSRLLRWIEGEDRRMLASVTAGDPEGFFRFVVRERDRRRICGLSPVYVLLHLMRGETGKLLHYGQWPDPQGTVTFCTVAFPTER